MTKKLSRFMLLGVFLLVIAFVAIKFATKGYKFPSFDYKDVNLKQLQMPVNGQEVATIETSVGTFKVMLFREDAPNTVEHFVKLAKDGYYDGTYIYQVQKDNNGKGHYFFGGTKKKDGYMVDKKDDNYTKEIYDIEHKVINNEISKNLWAFKGSLIAMGPDLKDSGTFITGVNSADFTDDLKDALKKEIEKKNANKDIINAFIEKGGQPTLQDKYTIFAQVYEGMDVFEKVFAVDTDKNGAPTKDLKINKITISNYGE